jgi:hypothetical protein
MSKRGELIREDFDLVVCLRQIRGRRIITADGEKVNVW